MLPTMEIFDRCRWVRTMMQLKGTRLFRLDTSLHFVELRSAVIHQLGRELQVMLVTGSPWRLRAETESDASRWALALDAAVKSAGLPKPAASGTLSLHKRKTASDVHGST
eukprot:TRINITY_DN3877_c0_g1_i1.p1 TRINITY_DN3877_c0_g1~~TRINITY_DN3877_c0_g1_i1.p1  ORF type:complete len:129 (-),score=26.93 TRINITY_DN3877_c0_g1_i1:404-733(-)